MLRALRTLGKSPGFLLLSVATACLGIAANAAIFSLFYQVLLRSLPVAQPSRLMVFHAEDFHLPGRTSNDSYETVFSYPMYRALRDSAHSLQGVAARSSEAVQMVADGSAERVRAEIVSGNFFEVLGLRPCLGRLLAPTDDRMGAGNPVAALSFDFWRKRFGGDASVLNRSVTVNGRIFTIVGVTPEGFRGVLSGNSPDLYFPLSAIGALDPDWRDYDRPGMSRFTLLGRLNHGVSRERAEQELAPVFASTLKGELTPLKISSALVRKSLESKRLQLSPAARGLNQLERQWRRPLLVMASMSAMLLLIGCANLANLLLARGVNRARETAIRLALGATRHRIFSMLLGESLVVAAGGAVLGIALTPVLTAGVLRLLPPDETGGWLTGGVNLPVLAFCALLMAATGIISGIAPAWQSARTSALQVLGDRTAAAGGGHLSPRVRQTLLVGQIALSLALLSTAGLFAKSLINLMRHNPGFRAGDVLTFSVDAGAGGYTAEASIALYRDVMTRLRALPGVEAVSIADAAPLSNDERSSNVTVEGYRQAEGENTDADRNAVGAGFFRLLGTPLIAGREFTSRDAPGTPKVAIVNEAFVRRFFDTRGGSGTDALGRHMEVGAGGPLDIQIVGIVRDIQNLTLREKVKPTFYLLYEQSKAGVKSFRATFFVRGRNAMALTAAARSAVAQLDSTLAVFKVATMQTRIDNSIYTDRLLAALTTAFGVLALMLTAIGLYGVTAYVVGRRTAEIGIRMALGATGGSVMALVLREVGMLTIFGVAAGIGLALLATRAVQSQLFGLDGLDLSFLVLTVMVLAGVALGAGAIPALRAVRIQPLRALQHE
jgi:predicted permease